MDRATGEATELVVLLRVLPPPSRGMKQSRDPKPGKPEPKGATPKELKNPEGAHPWSLIVLEASAATLPAHKIAFGITQGHDGNRGNKRETGSSLIARGLSAVASRQLQPPF